jgi:uncharacterized protein (TIGR00255 family)
MRSMTGFGAGEHVVGGKPPARLSVELRAVNHRFLDVRVRAPRELADLVVHAEMLCRERFSRGRFDFALRAEGLSLGAPTLDVERARGAYRQLCTLRDEIAPNETVPLSLLAVVPDLFRQGEAAGAGVHEALGAAFRAAADDLDVMRGREGSALEKDMREHLARIVEMTATVGARAPEALEAARRRLVERVDRLRTSAEGVDPTRLELELAILADRSDVAEEVARLGSHAEQLESLLGAAGPVGRRIDFLLQEMVREVNTLGSKSSDVPIARAVVELKAEIERLREQVQNVE